MSAVPLLPVLLLLAVPQVPAAPVYVPNEPPPFLDVQVAPLDNGAPSESVLAPIPTVAPPRAVVPIQPIPLDMNNPGPFAVDTPTTWSSGQLPGAPAPIYVTPIDFDAHVN